MITIQSLQLSAEDLAKIPPEDGPLAQRVYSLGVELGCHAQLKTPAILADYQLLPLPDEQAYELYFWYPVERCEFNKLDTDRFVTLGEYSPDGREKCTYIYSGNVRWGVEREYEVATKGIRLFIAVKVQLQSATTHYRIKERMILEQWVERVPGPSRLASTPDGTAVRKLARGATLVDNRYSPRSNGNSAAVVNRKRLMMDDGDAAAKRAHLMDIDH